MELGHTYTTTLRKYKMATQQTETSLTSSTQQSETYKTTEAENSPFSPGSPTPSEMATWDPQPLPNGLFRCQRCGLVWDGCAQCPCPQANSDPEPEDNDELATQK